MLIHDVPLLIDQIGLGNGLKIEGGFELVRCVAEESVRPAFGSNHRFYFGQIALGIDGDGQKLHVVFAFPIRIYFGDGVHFPLAGGAPGSPKTQDGDLALADITFDLHALAIQGFE